MPVSNNYISRILGNQFHVPTAGTGSSAPNMSSILESGIPGFGGLTRSATGIIGNLLTGLPSPSLARRENAYFGQASGLGSSNTDPTHDFLRNRGFDLYGEKAEQRQQTGLKDLLALLAGYSGSVVPTTGQVMQGNQFDQEFGWKQNQSIIDNAFKAAKLDQDRPKTKEYSSSFQKTNFEGQPVGRPEYHYKYFR